MLFESVSDLEVFIMIIIEHVLFLNSPDRSANKVQIRELNLFLNFSFKRQFDFYFSCSFRQNNFKLVVFGHERTHRVEESVVESKDLRLSFIVKEVMFVPDRVTLVPIGFPATKNVKPGFYVQSHSMLISESVRRGDVADVVCVV